MTGFISTAHFPGKGKPGYDSTYKIFMSIAVIKKVPTTPVMIENPADLHRETNVFERGNWMVKGDKVEADVPKFINPYASKCTKKQAGTGNVANR